MNKLMGKMGEGGKFRFSLTSVHQFLFEYVQIFWSNLIGSNFEKKHVELFAAEGCHCFARSAHARDNGGIRVNAVTGHWLRSCGLITGS
jgi:hypothetical protein